MNALRFLVFIASVVLGSSATAGSYWDCSVSYSSQRWDMTAGGGDFLAEIYADSRTQAESKVKSYGWTTRMSGVFSSKEVYVCPAGYRGGDTHDGKKCYYGMRNISCRRQ